MTEETLHTRQSILGVSGSPRANGNSDVLLKHVLKGAQEENIPTETILLRNYYFQPCVGCERCRKDKACTKLNDGMQILYPKIRASQGLVLACPTHNYNVTAWMKAFIDRLYCFYNFEDTRPRAWSSRLANQNRKAAIVAVCEQQNKKDMGFTLEAMRLPLEALGYEIVGELAVFRIFDRGAVRNEEDTLQDASALGKKLAASLR